MKSIEWKTFNQWSSQGYQIKKGSRATWIDNIPMFSSEQVKYSPPYKGNYTDHDMEDDYETADYYGISPWGGCGP